MNQTPPLRILAYCETHDTAKLVRSLTAPFGEIQVTSGLEQLRFLTTEWNPHIDLIEGTPKAIEHIPYLRALRPYGQFGILVLQSPEADSADGEERSLRSGADDFLRSPIHSRILHLRLTALYRRLGGIGAAGLGPSPTSSMDYLEFQSLRLYPKDFLVKQKGQTLTCSPTQFRLLLVFFTHRDQLLTRDQIKAAVWPDTPVSPRSIDAHISKLKKLIPELSEHLVNVYGQGYILTEDKVKAA